MAIPSSTPISVSPETAVIEAIRVMSDRKVGSVIVMRGGQLQGIFTERDVMLRVVLTGRNPITTRVEEVMTAPVRTVPRRITGDQALELMLQHHIRHLALVDDSGGVAGIVSMRSLLEQKVEDLRQQLDSLEAYMGADGIGG